MGSAGEGSLAGIFPTTLTPWASSPSRALTAAMTATVMSRSGSSLSPILVLSHLSPTTSAMEPSPICTVGQCGGPPCVMVAQKRTRKES